MKLASLKSGGRDGTLLVVSDDLSKAVKATSVAPSMQRALEEWATALPKLQALAAEMQDAFPVVPAELAAPLPRAYEFVDGSAYLPHVERVRKARGAEVPESFYTDPLMYQAVSAGFCSAYDPIEVQSAEYGIDLEAEVIVVTDEVPMGISPEAAAAHIVLVGLVNDVSLRNLIPNELQKGFGFLQSKPRSALSPMFVTPDALGAAWQGSKLHLPLHSAVNGKRLGEPEAGVDMQFSFAALIAHAAKTRPLSAGTIVGSGTVANHDERKGASCLAEVRTLEIIKHGKPSTPFLQHGDVIRIEMRDATGRSIFGAIEQKVSVG